MTAQHVRPGTQSKRVRQDGVKERVTLFPPAETAQEQIERLDTRLGKGLGATRERARLAKAKKTEELPPEEAPATKKSTKKKK